MAVLLRFDIRSFEGVFMKFLAETKWEMILHIATALFFLRIECSLQELSKVPAVSAIELGWILGCSWCFEVRLPQRSCQEHKPKNRSKDNSRLFLIYLTKLVRDPLENDRPWNGAGQVNHEVSDLRQGETENDRVEK